MPDFGDHRVMACTVADIERWLGEYAGQASVRRLVSADAAFIVDASALSLNDATIFPLTLATRALPPRVIALLRMPQLEVRFDYAPEHAARARAWIAGFDRHTQRGGG